MADLITWFVAEGHGYPLIFIALLVSGLGVPIPEDVPLLAAGVMATQGGLSVPTASLACGLFVLIRDSFVFWLGYRYGSELLEKRWAARIVRPATLHSIQARLQRSEKLVVFAGRFMPGLRGPVFFAAGAARVHPLVFITVDTFAALISVPVWVGMGYLFADNYEYLVATAKTFRVALFAAGSGALLLVALSWLRRRREDDGDAELERDGSAV